jgi:hypothetical protein
MQLISSDQLFWLVCAALYLSDTIKILDPRRMIVWKTGELGWRPNIPLYRFLVRGRALTILNPFTPWRITIVLSWLGDSHFSISELRRTRRRSRVWGGRLSAVRVASCAMFGGLFVLGPVVTELQGLVAGLLAVAPIYVAAWLTLFGTLVSNRSLLGIHWGQIAWRLVECALCPGYLANVWRRILIEHFQSKADAIIFCAQHMNAMQLGQMCHIAYAYIEDLRERDLIATEDQPALAAYQGLT